MPSRCRASANSEPPVRQFVAHLIDGPEVVHGGRDIFAFGGILNFLL